MAVAIAAVVLIMLVRIGRMSRKRKIRMERLWIGPAIFILAAGWIISTVPPPNSPLVYASMAGALVLGGLVGWFRGMTTRITLDVETHELMSQVSPWGLTFLLLIILVRLGVRRVLGGHVSAAALTDGFLVFYVGMVTVRRVEIFLRCRRLLADARAAKAAGETVPDLVTEERA